MSWLDEFLEGVKLDYGVGRDDRSKMFYETRARQNLDDDAPHLQNMAATYPLGYRTRELLGVADKEAIQARKEQGIGPLPTKAGQLGQLTGSLGADLTQDISRGWWWLMNAAQASGNVINETLLGQINPDLYGAQRTDIKYKDLNALEQAGLARRNSKGQIERLPGVFSQRGNAAKKNYRSGYVTALGIPTGVTINNALGLLSPFGGADGYEAVIPNAEDKSKTDNIFAEIATKYILGRTGNLLPYEEFNKVRPDVSRGEYNAYKAFKYDKDIDLNILDGDLTVPSGVVKFTTEGIHGPELQFLGRSLPLTTAGIPYMSALLGGALGVRRAKKYRAAPNKPASVDPNAVKRAFMGASLGAVGGITAGNLIEGERRRRNQAQNESFGEL
jgi:hypothetical protein